MTSAHIHASGLPERQHSLMTLLWPAWSLTQVRIHLSQKTSSSM